MSPDRDERERRLMASIVERDELIQRRTEIRDRARTRNLARHERNMRGWGRDREAGSGAVMLLLCAPGLLLALLFTVRIVAAVASLTGTLGGVQ